MKQNEMLGGSLLEQTQQEIDWSKIDSAFFLLMDKEGEIDIQGLNKEGLMGSEFNINKLYQALCTAKRDIETFNISMAVVKLDETRSG